MHNQNKDVIDTIFKVEEKNFCRLKSELSEYIRRQSFEFSNEDRRATEDVLLRSIQKIVRRRGEPSKCLTFGKGELVVSF